jgi:phenylpyruvate tautomerase PptA (4-oxalocrotonate tautomerase family)
MSFGPRQRRKEIAMPVVLINAPPGVRPEAKKRMMEKIHAALAEVHQPIDTLIFLQEHPPENVAENGGLQSENPQVLEGVQRAESA